MKWLSDLYKNIPDIFFKLKYTIEKKNNKAIKWPFIIVMSINKSFIYFDVDSLWTGNIR